MNRLSVSLLGGFEARLDGRHLQDFQTDKVRALFCYLMVENAQAHHREYLAGFLWPDQEEARARHNLRQALSTLRKLLGDHQNEHLPFLQVNQETIRVNPSASCYLDVQELIDLSRLNAVHRHKAPGCCLPCLRRLARMNEIYKGNFLEKIPFTNSDLFDEWALLKKEWLSRIMVDGLGELAGFGIRRGEWATVREFFHKQLELDPWREEAHRMLMQLYAHNGQRSAALVQFQRCSSVLQEELGIAPAAETIRLNNAIQTGALNTEELFPPPLSILPPNPSPFVGRKADLFNISEILANPDCRLITLFGPGGAGKTRLAMQTGYEHLGIFPDGVYFVGLADAATNLQAVDAISNVLQVAINPQLPLEGQVIENVKNKEMFLILDNFEQLQEDSEFLARLLHHAPNLKVLVTSRKKILLQEEWVYEVEGMNFPRTREWMEAAPADDGYDSLVLFAQRARQAKNTFLLNAENRPAVCEICELLEGNPLGLEMAAAATSDQSCDSIARSLKDNLKLLSHRFRNIPERHRSLQAAFETSWSMLSTAEQTQLASLSIFRGGFTAEAAQYVLSTDQTHLESLVAKSFVRLDGTKRYWIHEVIRQFARDHLQENPEREVETIARHGDFYFNWIQGFLGNLSGRGSSDAVQKIQVELANILAAWNQAVATSQFATVLAVLPILSQYYQLRGPLPDGVAIFRQAIIILTERIAPDTLIASMRLELARLLGVQARYDEALLEVGQAVQIAGPGIEAIFLKGQLLHQQGKHDQARQFLEQSLTMAASAENQPMAAESLRELGSIAVRESDVLTARGRLQSALAYYQSQEDWRGITSVFNNLGVLAYSIGEYTTARVQLNQALEGYRLLGDLRGEAKTINNLANLEADLGNYLLSIQLYKNAFVLYRRINNPRGRSSALMNLGGLYCELGDYGQARNLIDEALVIFNESNNLQAQGEALANLSLVEHLTGNQALALTLAEKAIAISERCEDLYNLSNALTYQGRSYLSLGDLEAAASSFNRAIRIQTEIAHPHRLAEMKAELAFISFQQNRTELALETIKDVTETLQKSPRLDGCEDIYRVYWICHQVLKHGDPERAVSYLHKAHEMIMKDAEKINDPHLKRCLLEKRPSCKIILDLVSRDRLSTPIQKKAARSAD